MLLRAHAVVRSTHRYSSTLTSDSLPVHTKSGCAQPAVERNQRHFLLPSDFIGNRFVAVVDGSMTIDRTPAAGIAFAKRVRQPRILGCGLSFLFVATAIYPGTWTLWGLMLFNGFIWPLIAYQLAIRSASVYRAELRNLHLDCVLAGFWVVAMQFSVLPSLLLISMAAMNCVVAKGNLFMLQGLLANALGVLGGGAVFGFSLTTETPSCVVWACMPMLVVYPIVVGSASYRLAQQLFSQQKALTIVSSLDEGAVMSHSDWLYELAQAFHRCRCSTAQATLACICIESFHSLHAQYGEVVMNALSIRLGRLIQDGVRSSDFVSRKRPGEFWVLFLHSQTMTARGLTQRIEERFDNFCGGPEGVPESRILVAVVEFSHGLSGEGEWMLQVEERLLDNAIPSVSSLS